MLPKYYCGNIVSLDVFLLCSHAAFVAEANFVSEKQLNFRNTLLL